MVYKIKFYREIEFKEVPELGIKVPKDWDVVRLGDKRCFEILKSGIKYFEGYKRYVSVSDIIKNKIVSYTLIKYKSKPCRANMQPVLNSVWFARLKDTNKVYVFDIFNKSEVDLYIFSTGYCGILCKEGVYTRYIEQFFLSKFFNNVKNSLSTGSTQKDIKNNEIIKIKIPLPPLQEQKAIAEILSTIDKAIELTEESIKETEKLKKAMMKKLFTEGIGHKGFKDTEIGRIPKSWNVVELRNEKYFEIVMGQSPPSSSYNRNRCGLPFLQGKAEFGDICPTPVLYTTKPLKVVDKGDILISVRAPVGDVNIAPFKLCIGRGLAGIKPNKKKVDTFFIFYYLTYIKPKIECLGGGSTFKAITKKDLDNIKVPLPSLSEQKQIANILSTIDKRMEILKEKKELYEKVKKYYMDQLLTGKLRVM
jgi:type I restriction enzyme S subunit